MRKKIIIGSVLLIGAGIVYFAFFRKKNKLKEPIVGSEGVQYVEAQQNPPIGQKSSQIKNKSKDDSKITNKKNFFRVGSIKQPASQSQITQFAAIACPNGYVYDAVLKSCRPIENSNLNNSTNATPYCPPGYFWNSIMQSCTKIN